MIDQITNVTTIDVLINNAGIHETKSFMDYELQDFKRVIETNLYSVFLFQN